MANPQDVNNIRLNAVSDNVRIDDRILALIACWSPPLGKMCELIRSFDQLCRHALRRLRVELTDIGTNGFEIRPRRPGPDY
jgi:hypothetical protein